LHLAGVGDEVIDVGLPCRCLRQTLAFRQPTCRDPEVLGARFGQLVLDEAGENWQHGRRVDLLVAWARSLQVRSSSSPSECARF
jgi:hypothetical protein